MLVLLVAVLANLVGFVALAAALALGRRLRGGPEAWLRSSQGLGVLCVGAAGLFLALGGQYKLARTIQVPGEQAEGLARLHLVLDEPLDQLLLRVQGPDPFQDRRVTSILRLRFRLQSGQEFTSDVPRGRLLPVEAESEDALYGIPWSAVRNGAETPEGRAAAARFQRVGDFRRVRHLALGVIQRGHRPSPLPDALLLGVNQRPTPLLFRGDQGGTLPVRYEARNPPPDAREAGLAFVGASPLGVALAVALRQLREAEPLWVATCDDDASPAARIATLWQWDLTPPTAELGTLLTVMLGGGGLLIAVGVGLLGGEERAVTDQPPKSA